MGAALMVAACDRQSQPPAAAPAMAAKTASALPVTAAAANPTPSIPADPRPSPDATATPAAAPGREHWGDQFERVQGGPDAELMIRVGSISNLGFGWPDGFDPFSGKSTPSHGYPWDPPPDAPPGLKRIMLGSAVTRADLDARRGDGYIQYMMGHDTHVQPIQIPLGQVPAKIDGVLFQFFLDDFQAPYFGSHFQVSLNGTRIPAFEQIVNAVDQTGPIGKLVSAPLLPEYYDLLQSGSLKLVFDDPETHVPDGFAIDFVRVLFTPRHFPYVVKLQGTVLDADTRQPVADATVTAALLSTQTGSNGQFTLSGVPAGLVVATAIHEGYGVGANSVDVEAGQVGQVEILLHRAKEDAASLQEQIDKTGIVAIYGIHFDVDKSLLRPDSAPALQAVLGIIQKAPAAHWIVSGHTDNTGTKEHNVPLSLARAQSVGSWLEHHGIDAGRYTAVGIGADRPVANNATAGGRALNRRVELQRQD